MDTIDHKLQAGRLIINGPGDPHTNYKELSNLQAAMDYGHDTLERAIMAFMVMDTSQSNKAILMALDVLIGEKCLQADRDTLQALFAAVSYTQEIPWEKRIQVYNALMAADCLFFALQVIDDLLRLQDGQLN